MSDKTIVEVVTVEASTLTVDVIAPPPAYVVVEVADWGSVPVTYSQLPVGLKEVPISFPFDGGPTPGTEISVPMTFPLIVPPNLAGTETYAMTLPTDPRTFTLNRISTGIVTELGTVTFTPALGVLLVGAGGRLGVGDTLQLTSPPDVDPTLADVGITILLNRGD